MAKCFTTADHSLTLRFWKLKIINIHTKWLTDSLIRNYRNVTYFYLMNYRVYIIKNLCTYKIHSNARLVGWEQFGEGFVNSYHSKQFCSLSQLFLNHWLLTRVVYTGLFLIRTACSRHTTLNIFRRLVDFARKLALGV